MAIIMPGPLLALRRPWTRAVLLGLVAALLLASVGALAGLPSLGWLGWERSVRGVPRTEAVSLDADRSIASLCLADAQAPAMRRWISQHPKSQRGRLDHQRSRLVAGE